MNSRERFLATMAFDRAEGPPLWEASYWAKTVRLWYEQGLPKVAGIPNNMEDGEDVRGELLGWKLGKVQDSDVHNYLQLDPGMVRAPVDNYLCPQFERTTLEEHGDWSLVRDEWGVVSKQKRDLSTLPEFLSGPVSNRDDFERLAAERLRPSTVGRIPDDWAKFVDRVRDSDLPISLGGSQGFFGTLRYLLGPIALLFAYHDKPDLVKYINSYLADFWVSLYDQVLGQVHVDMAVIWEDMCYKNGPLISPAMFDEFMLPYYLKLTSLFRDHGVSVIAVETDGDCRALIPGFIKGGVTAIFPMEVTGGMDVAQVGAQYPKLQLFGGLSKVAVAEGPKAIDRELEAKIPPLIRRGGYIPMADHALHPDVSWQNFVYYRGRVASLAGRADDRGIR